VLVFDLGRAVSAALHTSPVATEESFLDLVLQTKLQSPKTDIQYETLEMSEVFINPHSVLSCKLAYRRSSTCRWYL